MESANSPHLEGLDVIKQLYKTKNSTIYLVKDKATQNICVLKGINRFSLSAKAVEMVKRERSFYEENANVLKNNKFPVFLNPFKDDNNVYMEISFIPGLNLSELLLNDNLLKFNYKGASKELYLCLVSQVVSMIEELHKNNYIYRDLKLNNIIIDRELNCFLVDFGFVKHFDSQAMRTSTICGTLHMKAPEIYKLAKNEVTDYDGRAADIYSIGILMYEMFKGQSPFPYQCDDEEKYSNNVIQGLNDTYFGKDFYGNLTDDKDKKFADDVKDLILKCSNTIPEKRIAITEIKADKLFNGKFNDYITMGRNLFMCGNDCSQSKKIIDYINFHGEFKEDYLISEENKKMEDIFNEFF